jgi:hypothetical protein
VITITNTIAIITIVIITIANITISPSLNGHIYAHNQWEADSRFFWNI